MSDLTHILQRVEPGDATAAEVLYPVTIVHLPVQSVLASWLLPLPLPAVLKLLRLLAGTFGVCLALCEYGLRRLKWVRPLFGMG